MDEQYKDLLGEVSEEMKNRRERAERYKLMTICATVLIAVAMICGTFLGCWAIYHQNQVIIEQQYALNMQFASMSDLLYGAEIVTETTTYEADSGENGTAIVGENTVTVGGDMNGNG